MSENIQNSRHRVIVCAAHDRKLLKQNYTIEIQQQNTKYPSAFFNECLEEIDENAIYGFLSFDNNFLTNLTIEDIVSTFNKYELTQVVYSDYILQEGKFSYYQYLPAFHPNLLNYTKQFISTPLFVRGAALKRHNAKFHPALQHLALHGFFLNICRKAFAIHIPKLLFTRTGTRNINVTQEVQLIKQWRARAT